MKKMTKRIMALMLSLVMILGCVPSFINEASANDVNTVRDLLSYTSFPKNLDNYLLNTNSSNGEKMYVVGDYLVVDGVQMLLLDAGVTPGDSCYTANNGISFKFNVQMQNNTLTSIEISGYNLNTDFNGTYEPVPVSITIGDVLNTVEFPTSATYTNTPNDAWVSSDGKKIYKCDNNLFCFIGSNTRELPNLDENVSATEGGYSYTPSRSTYIFVMTGGKLTSIIIDDETHSYSGTYEPVKTIADILDTVEGGFPTSNSDGWRTNGSIGFSAYVDDNSLTFFNGESPKSYSTNSSVKKNGDNYIVDNENITLVMTDGKLTSIVSTITDYVGTYKRVEKNVTVTIPTTAGLTVEEIRNSATLTDPANTANFNTATIDSTDKRSIQIYGLKDDGSPNMSDKKASDYALEKDKEYMAVIQLKDAENVIHYKSVNVNDKTLYFSSSSTNAFFIQTELIIIKYVFTANDPQPAPSGGGSSKKYKASDSKDTAEKVSGSGKKGSTRTITPIEGKKVSSVIVTDKDGNKVDVTLNEDGTYSFKQPASDVTIEVTYKNREITLNIGSTEAEVDGEKSNLDVCPVVRNDRTMLPIRYVAENLGAKVEWNEKKPDYVAITRGDTKIEITLGSDIMLVNEKEVKLDSVAFAENDRTYLPVRAISEALNAIVEWNEEKPMEVKIYER